MGKSSDGFFKRKNPQNLEADASLLASNVEIPISEDRPTKSQRTEINEVDISSLERDPGLRPQIWDYDINQRDEIRRKYIKVGPYQPMLSKYPKSRSTTHLRSFQHSWFKLFPSWLEYSPKKYAIFCLLCYLFNKQIGLDSQNAFTLTGFKNWKKVKDGRNCDLLNHVGKDPNSPHKVAERSCEDLMNQSQHIQKVLDKFTSEEIANNRLRLTASIDTVRWLTFQGCAFRGHDESHSSINRGNYIEMLNG